MPRLRLNARAGFIFIFITVILDMLALGMIVPILPKLLLQFEGGDTARAAHVVGLFGTLWAIMHFVFSPLLGVLSDRIGRRPVILLSNLGMGIDYLLMAVAPTLGWLLVGRLVSGITAASVTAANAYIGDVTPPAKRAAAFGMLGAAFGLGFVIGPAIGGILGHTDPRLPFWVAGGLSLLNFCYGFFVLPESLATENRRAFSWQRANPVGSFRFLRAQPQLTSLATISFLAMLAHAVLPSTWVLYTSYRYGWDERTTGLTLALVGVITMVVQGGLVGPVVAWLGERRAFLLGTICGVTGFLIQGFAPTQGWFWLGILPLALWGIANSAINGMMSNLVGPRQQGELQGATSCIRGIGELIGPALFAGVFAHFISRETPIPGSSFILAGLICSLALLLALKTQRPTQA